MVVGGDVREDVSSAASAVSCSSENAGYEVTRSFTAPWKLVVPGKSLASSYPGILPAPAGFDKATANAVILACSCYV
jgi:hypothetical protein